MDSLVLEELIENVQEDESTSNLNDYSLNDLIKIIKNSDKYDMFVESMKNIRKDLFIDDEIHGVSHNERVTILAFAIGIIQGLNEKELKLVIEASKYHDIGRTEVKGKEHGKRSAEIIENMKDTLLSGFSDEEINIVKTLCICHNMDDLEFESIARQNGIKNVEQVRRLQNVVKDADALDRVRLTRFGKLDESYLRTEESKMMIRSAKELLERYKTEIVKSKYNRDSIQRDFNADLFGISSYNVIEDDENYYVFRSLNSSNEADLKDEEQEFIRTSRRLNEERAQEESTGISLEEMYDNIRFNRSRVETDCISFSTNANVTLDYSNHGYAMMAIPKNNTEKMYISGKFILSEIDKRISEKISELLIEESKNKEVLSYLSQINECDSTEKIREIVSESFREVKRTQGKYKGAKNSILTKNAIFNRFTRKQYLNEAQQLEYDKLIAKLTVLEIKNELRNIIPTQPSNTRLLGALGMAFSSSEMIHYEDVPKGEIQIISKNNMEVFSLLQQLDAIEGIDKQKIEQLKKAFLVRVKEGFSIQEVDEKIRFASANDYIEIGENSEFKHILIDREITDIVPVESAFQLLKTNNGVLPYAKGNAAVKFARELAIARVKNLEYWRFLRTVFPEETKDIDESVFEKTIAINPRIISRINNSGVQISESVNIDMADTVTRSFFTNEEIRKIYEKVSNLPENELRILTRKNDYLKNNFFSGILEGKNYEGSENNYYIELVLDNIDFTKIYTYLSNDSEKITNVKEKLREKLEGVDTKKIFDGFYRAKVPIPEISYYIVNLILDDGIGKDVKSFEELVNLDNLDSFVKTNINNFSKNVSAYRLDEFIGVRDNDYVIPGTKIVMRDYQKEALENLSLIYGKGKRFAGVKLPTGAGKSFIAMAEMMRRSKENMVYFAPQEEILSQVKRHIVRYVLDKEILTKDHVQMMLDMSEEEQDEFLKNKIYNSQINVKSKLKLLTVSTLEEQEREKIVSSILPRNTAMYDDVMDAIKTVFPHLEMCCYQSLNAEKYNELMKKNIDFFVFDELHRSGASTWEYQIKKLLEKQKEAQILGITATPVRDNDKKDTMYNMAERYGGYTEQELIEKDYYAAEMTLIDAMQRGLVVEPLIVPFDYNLRTLDEYKEIETTIAELRRKNTNPSLLQILEKNKAEMDEIIDSGVSVKKDTNFELVGIDDVIAKNVRASNINGRFIVFLPMKPRDYKGTTEEYVNEEIKQVRKNFEKLNPNIKTGYLLSNRVNANEENAKAINEFETSDSDELKLLFAINKLNEGVHVIGLNGELMLRPIGEDSNILYFQQIGRVIYAIDPDNPPSEDEIPIIFDVYNNYIARDLDREANISTSVSDLSRLQEIINWTNKHETLPDINSSDIEEARRAIALKKIQKKYKRYVDEVDNQNLNLTEVYEIERIMELARSINLFELDLGDRIVDDLEKEIGRVRTFEVVGTQKKFMELYKSSKRAIKQSKVELNKSDRVRIKENIAILKTLSNYGLAITDESFEKINQNKYDINLLEYINTYFEPDVVRDVLRDIDFSEVDAEMFNIYNEFDYLRNAFSSQDNKVRKNFAFYDLTDLRKCGIFYKDGHYITIIDQYGFVKEFDVSGNKAPSTFVDLNVETGTKYDLDGFDVFGYDEEGYNREGYNKEGYDRLLFRKDSELNKYGFKRDFTHGITGNHLDKNFFDIYGNYWESDPESSYNVRNNTFSQLNTYGFNRDGKYCEYNENGELVEIGVFDRLFFKMNEEFNMYGFNRERIHIETNEAWDLNYFDIDGYYWKQDPSFPNDISKRIKTDSKIDERYMDRDGNNYRKDKNGKFVLLQENELTQEMLDRGFNRQGINLDTGERWDCFGFDADGYYWKNDPRYWRKRIPTGGFLNELGFNYRKKYCEIDEKGEVIEIGDKDPEGYGFGEDAIDDNGFNRKYIYVKTNKPFNEQFFDKHGYFWEEDPDDPFDITKRRRTDRKYDEFGKDMEGKPVEGVEQREINDYEFTRERIPNKRGFRITGIHAITGEKWDPKGYDILGNYWEKNPKHRWKRYNTNRKVNGIGLDRDGYFAVEDEDGTFVRLFRKHDEFNITINKKEEDTVVDGKKVFAYKTGGFDIDGYWWTFDTKNKKYVNTHSRYCPETGLDMSAYTQDGVYEGYNRFGFNPDHRHRNGTLFDDRLFNYKRIHKNTGKYYDEEFFDIEGYYWEISPDSPKRRIRSDSKINEFGADYTGEIEEDAQGYDDIGMLNFVANVNDDFPYRQTELIARQGETLKQFRAKKSGIDQDRTDYFYMDSNEEYSLEDGRNYAGFNREGFDKDGKTETGETYKKFELVFPEPDDSENIDFDDFFEDEPRTLEEERLFEALLKSQSSRFIYDPYDYLAPSNKIYPDRRGLSFDDIELGIAMQNVRDQWDISTKEYLDDDGESLFDPFGGELIYEDTLKLKRYMEVEDELDRRTKHYIKIDVHHFDKNGYYYNVTPTRYMQAKRTGKKYDDNFFDKNGYYVIESTETPGYYRSTGSKLNPQGFDQDGFYHDPETKESTGSKYDPEGYDIKGYNKIGFDRKGLSREGKQINNYGFRADGTCTFNHDLLYDECGFKVDGTNIYTGGYTDVLGRVIGSKLPDPRNIIDTKHHVNLYGINPKNGKNQYGVIDPTIRFTRYFYAEIFETGRDEAELVKSLAGAYRIDEEKMRRLAYQKIFIAMNGYPKMKEEVMKYFRANQEKINSNYTRINIASKRGTISPKKADEESIFDHFVFDDE